MASLWSQRLMERALRFIVSRLPYTIQTKREWLIVNNSLHRTVAGEIPRDIAEGLGLDTSPIDSGGTCFIEYTLSEKIRSQPEWRATHSSGGDELESN